VSETQSNASAAKPETPENELVLIEDHDTWALMTINRPEKRNAMSRAAQRRFMEALDEVRDKRAVVLTGVGPSFCAGVDLKEGAANAGSRAESSGQQDSWSACNEAVRRHPAIFIAAVNGFALGGGSTLIHNCELAVAGESATIGTPEIGFGAWPGLAGPALIKRVLPKHAAEIIFLAQRIDAATAYRMGIVNEVVADDQLLTRATELAEHIGKFDRTVLDWGKKAFRQMISLSWDDAMDLSRYTRWAVDSNRAQVEGFSMQDFAEGKRGTGQGA